MKKVILAIFVTLFLSGCQIMSTETTIKKTTEETTQETTTTLPSNDQLGTLNNFLLFFNDQDIYYGKDKETFSKVYTQSGSAQLCEGLLGNSWYYGCRMERHGKYINFNSYNGVILNVEDGSTYKPKHFGSGQIIYLPNESFKDLNKRTLEITNIKLYDEQGEQFISSDSYTYYHHNSNNHKLELKMLSNGYNRSYFNFYSLDSKFTQFAAYDNMYNVLVIFNIHDNLTIDYKKIENAQYSGFADGIITYIENNMIHQYDINTKEDKIITTPVEVGLYVRFYQDLIIFTSLNTKSLNIYNVESNKIIKTFDYRTTYYLPIVKEDDKLFIETDYSIIIYSLSNNTVLHEFEGEFALIDSSYEMNQAILRNQNKINWVNFSTGQVTMNDLNDIVTGVPIITNDFIYFVNENTIIYKDSNNKTQIPNSTSVNTAYILSVNKLYVAFNDGSAYIVYKDRIEQIEWLTNYLQEIKKPKF